MKTASYPSRLGAAALSAFVLSGCIANNLFSGKEVPLPGERIPVMQAAVGPAAAGGTANPGAPAPLADWSQPGGNAANAPGHISLAGSGTAVAWRARALDGGSRRDLRSSAPPIVHGGRIYAYSADATVSALSTSGGTQWRTALAPEGERSRTPGGGIAAAGQAIYAATGFGDLVALDSGAGGRIWSYALGAPARSAPTTAGGRVFVVDAAGTLHAVNAADGSRAWTYAGLRESAGLVSSASPAVSGNTVVVPYASGEIIAVDTGTGKARWGESVVRSTRTLAVSSLKDVAASPVIADGVVFATGVAGRTIAVDLASGDRLWDQNIGSASTPVVSGNAAYLIDLRDNMVALDRRTGRPIWTTALPVVRKSKQTSVWTGPVLAGGALRAVSNDGRMISVDPSTGSIAGDVALAGPAYSRPIAASGLLLVQTADGTLTAFQ